MTTVRAQPPDKPTIVPGGSRTCAGQMHIYWVFGGGENHGPVHVSEASADAFVCTFSQRIYSLRRRPTRQLCRRHLQAALRLNAGDKERCLQDPSDVHPHAT